MTNIKFKARKISTGEERIFTFDDMYGYEGEECGIFLKYEGFEHLSEGGNWAINFNSGYGYKGMNDDIEITIMND